MRLLWLGTYLKRRSHFNFTMTIYLGADHRGFKLKETLKQLLQEAGYKDIVDLGNTKYDKDDDYPDFGIEVAKKVSLDPKNSRGILLCGSGVGMDIIANRYPNVRSVLAMIPDQATTSRKDDDSNVLSLGADFVSENEVKKIVTVWLQTDFSGEERHRRRLQKIDSIDTK